MLDALERRNMCLYKAFNPPANSLDDYFEIIFREPIRNILVLSNYNKFLSAEKGTFCTVSNANEDLRTRITVYAKLIFCHASHAWILPIGK